jgi:acetyl esterase/lipase
MGASAGGYLALVTGYRVKPRPAVLVSFWGYGDLVGAWYSSPSPHPRHHQIVMTEEEAWKQVDGAPVSDARQRPGNAGAFYQHCRRRGSWPKAVSGWDPVKDSSLFHPYMPLRNVTRDYPPTLLIHGTADTDVPFEQSAMMAQELARNEVPHRLVRIAGGEHGLAGGDPAEIDAAYQTALSFVGHHMRR